MTEYLFGITDTGMVRDNNEDLFLTEELLGGKYLVAGVIDGVGGYDGGEIAAALTKEIVLDELSVIGNNVIAQLEIAFNLANEEILAKKLVSNDFARMACVATIVVIDRTNNQLHYIHVGDTRLYLFRDNSLVKLSHDQSFVGFLEDSGRITEEAAMNHPKRNQINQALGLSSIMGNAEAYFETGSSPFLPADLILICSDGLTDLVDKTALSTVLAAEGSLQDKALKLVEKANAAGGKDNVTVVLARNDSKPASHEITRPVPEAKLPLDTPQKEFLPPTPPEPVKKQEITVLKPKSNSYVSTILAVLCLLLAGLSLLLYLNYKPVVVNPHPPLVQLKKTPGVAETLLQQLVDSLKSDTLLLSDSVFKQPILLTKPLLLSRDTLILKTKGTIILSAEPAYRGPAIQLRVNANYVELHDLVIKNFKTGIIAHNSALDMNNIQFINCPLPVNNLFIFADSAAVSGRIAKRTYRIDTNATN